MRRRQPNNEPRRAPRDHVHAADCVDRYDMGGLGPLTVEALFVTRQQKMTWRNARLRHSRSADLLLGLSVQQLDQHALLKKVRRPAASEISER
jgi:hypothetical protein